MVIWSDLWTKELQPILALFGMQSSTATIPISTFFTIDTNEKILLSRTNGVFEWRQSGVNYISDQRPNASESPRIEFATSSLSQLRSHRQVQLPLAIPGVFIRADAESPSMSCTGAIAMQATELQMARIIPKWMWDGSQCKYRNANSFSALISL